jgi:hypothetical protein
MCRWQRCDLVSDSRHRVSDADPEDPLDRLSDLAADLFSPIPNRGQSPLPSIPDHPFGSDEKGVRSTFTSYLRGLAVAISAIDPGLRSNHNGHPIDGNNFSDRRTDRSLAVQAG